MQIALADRKKTPFWFLTGTPIALNYSAPGPINVDVDALNEQQKKMLFDAIRCQKLLADQTVATPTTSVTLPPVVKEQVILSEVLVDAPAIVAPAVVAPVIEQPKPQIKSPIDVYMEKKARLLELLKSPWTNIKGKLKSMSHGEVVMLRDLEVKGKNRDKLVKELDGKIDEYNGQVAASIKANANPSAKPMNNAAFTNLPEVNESEMELKTIVLTPDDLMKGVLVEEGD